MASVEIQLYMQSRFWIKQSFGSYWHYTLLSNQYKYNSLSHETMGTSFSHSFQIVFFSICSSKTIEILWVFCFQGHFWQESFKHYINIWRATLWRNIKLKYFFFTWDNCVNSTLEVKEIHLYSPVILMMLEQVSATFSIFGIFRRISINHYRFLMWPVTIRLKWYINLINN